MRLALALAVLAAAAAAQDDDDYYISLPLSQAIWRIDSETLQISEFATGLSVPFYGEWLDGKLYIPNRGGASVVEIDMTGNVETLASGTWAAPVTIAIGPDGLLYVSDIFNDNIQTVDPDTGATEVFVDDTPGLMDGAGGLCFDLDGVLYVANFNSSEITGVNPDGTQFLVTDGGGLLDGPGGIQVDGAGNLFAANYNTGTITRTRLDTDVTTIFNDDAIMVRPNDVKLSNQGKLYTTVKVGALVSLDVFGNATTVFQDTDLGEFDGVAVPEDFPRCTGRLVRYGAGTAGTGGLAPSLRGVFSPCPGAAFGIEIEDVLPGAPVSVFWSLAPAALPFKGGELLVSLAPPSGQFGLVTPGALTLPAALPPDPLLTGASLYMQALVGDAQATGGVALSNGLEILIGQ